MKIVINHCYGGFGLSRLAYEKLKVSYDDSRERSYRTNKELITLIKDIGSKKVSGNCAKLAIIEIPNDVEWIIQEYDGLEHVAEKHRTWN